MNENDLQKLLTMDIVEDVDIKEDELENEFEALKDGTPNIEIDSEQHQELVFEEEVDIDTAPPHEQGDFLIALETNTKEQLLVLMNEFKLNAIQNKKLGKTDLALSYMKGLKTIQEKIKELEPLNIASDIPSSIPPTTTKPSPTTPKRKVPEVEKSIDPIVDPNMITQIHHQIEVASLNAKIFLKLEEKPMAVYFHRLSKLSQSTLDHYPTKLSATLVEWIEPSYNPFVTPNTIQVEISHIDGISCSDNDNGCEIFVLIDIGPSTDKPAWFSHDSIVKANACSNKYNLQSHLELNEKFHFQIANRIRKPLNITICKSYPYKWMDYFSGQRIDKIGKLTIDINQTLKGFEWTNLLQIMDGRKPTDVHLKLTIKTRKLLNTAEKTKKSETWYLEDSTQSPQTSSTPNAFNNIPVPAAVAPIVVQQDSIQPIKAMPAPVVNVQEPTPVKEPRVDKVKQQSPSTPQATTSPVGAAESDPNEVLFNPDYMTSNLVFEHYLQLWSKNDDKADECQQIQLKVNMLGIKVSSGQLTMDAYQKLLTLRFEVLKKLALNMKSQDKLPLAQEAMIQIKKIKQEIDEIKQLQS